MNAAAARDDADGDDGGLVARAREGDAAAFDELVRRHQAAVYRAALAAVGSHADADDVAQEAFLLAYRRLKSFRGESTFKTWMLTITWNQAMNHRRAAARWWKRFAGPVSPGSTVAHETAPEYAATTGTPEDLAAQSELRDAVRQAIRALPSKLRDALLLAQSGDYSYDEIGTMLKAPTGTIKWRVSEARRLIKPRLQSALGQRHR